MIPSELMKAAVMTPLQQQVYEIGVCARCHTKTMCLRHLAADAGLEFWQCSKCNQVAMLECSSHSAPAVIASSLAR